MVEWQAIQDNVRPKLCHSNIMYELYSYILYMICVVHDYMCISFQEVMDPYGLFTIFECFSLSYSHPL